MADLTPERLAELRTHLERNGVLLLVRADADGLLTSAARGLQHDRLVAALREAREWLPHLPYEGRRDTTALRVRIDALLRDLDSQTATSAAQPKED